MKKENRGFTIFLSIIILILVISSLGILFSWDNKGNPISKKETVVSDSFKIDDIPNDKNSNIMSGKKLSSTQVAEKVTPSVAAIVVYQNGRAIGQGSAVSMSYDKEKNETAFITCNHIVEKSGTNIKIMDQNGKEYPAVLRGRDKPTDLAVVIAKTNKFPPAEFGDSSKLKVGNVVYAIGNPYSLDFYGSFTAGVVSTVNRPLKSNNSIYSLRTIQHDAAINPGNSGGALVNEFGQVVGINSAKVSSEAFEGMGFAIPISDAKPIIDQLMSKGKINSRSKLGITYIPAGNDDNYEKIVEKHKLPEGSIVIVTIDHDSDVVGKNIRAKDIITHVNGTPLTSPEVLSNTIIKSKPGDEIELTVVRVSTNGEIQKITEKVKLVKQN
ncbi:MAG: trypsin-like peptidase domain-containing protein [Clostridia bacterium]|nr:trypsin-like peptidase domain-containing protein [Clostridia bacterium]